MKCSLAGLYVLLLTLLAGSVIAQPDTMGVNFCNTGVARNCADNTGMTSQVRCTAMRRFSSLTVIPPMTRSNSNVATCSATTTATSATGLYRTVQFIAIANKTSPATRFCNWHIQRGNTGYCLISSADGLPVELMDFAVAEQDAHP